MTLFKLIDGGDCMIDDLICMFPKTVGGRRIEWSLRFDQDRNYRVKMEVITKENTSWEGNGQSMWNYAGNKSMDISTALLSALDFGYHEIKHLVEIYSNNPVRDVSWIVSEREWLEKYERFVGSVK